MNHEPINEESGITLWSMSSYLKRAVTGITNDLLQKAENDEMLACVQKKVMSLTGEEFQIKLDITSEDGMDYFWYEIPIFWAKYEKYTDENKENREGETL